MEKRIVVPIDYSDVSKDVALFADKWAVRTIGKLYFLHVSRLPQVSYYPGHFEYLDQRDVRMRICTHLRIFWGSLD